ncbi:protein DETOXIFICATION 14-like isoform X1 [Actinidia eriantha]|uniref:protein DETOXIFICATION 14-like isoform X1 n=1 Tax=Actinidia eriantha TaxID=165200 RepID=UPI00258D06B9|nr:protein DETOXIFICATION 14-like isoform X1 [Actinidia eriantha]
MEEALLPENKERRAAVATWEEFGGELKKVGSIATPMVVVTVSQYLLQVVSMSMAGHLGEVSLSSTAIAASFTNVTGFSLLFGMAGALETLCGQAYGAKQYQKLGIYTFAAIFSLILVCLPVSLLWTFLDKILINIGQDPSISHKAGKFAIWLIPSLFPYAILQSLVRYLQAQSLILPMLLCSVATLCFHIPVCWALVFKTDMGNCGAALAIGLSYWLNAILLGFYLKYSAATERTPLSFSKEVFLSIGEFFRFAVPSAVMVCLEWWSSELLVLLSGLLPNAQLETSVLSICLTIASLHFYVPYSFGAAASTRVSNELGAGNPEAARLSTWAVMVLEAAEVTIASTTLFFCRYVLGNVFSDEKEVVDYVRDMVPLICLFIVVDSFQAVLSGVARGCGWQHIGAYVNLGAFYLVAIPTALVFGFVFLMGGRGFWIGLTTGPTLQFILLSLITSLTDWQKQANNARERLLKGERFQQF